MKGNAVKGFDPRFKDYPDYLMAVSREIWEERRLAGRLAELYHPQVTLRDAGGLLHGETGVAGSILPVLAALPGMRLLSEDVIWSGTPQVGMLGSQRLLAQGRHAGAGLYGAPTGRLLAWRMLTDSYAKDNRISDAWQVADTAAILAQLSLDPDDWAARRADGRDPETQPFRPVIDDPGPYTGQGNDNHWGTAFADLLDHVMQGAYSAIPDQYDRACTLAYPGGTTAHAPDAAEAFWLGLRASFPSATFTIHHRIGMEEPLLPPRAAIRWSLQGRHDGWGAFGAPSGAEVHVMGISHAEFGPWGLRREFTLYDDTAIRMQIAAHRG